MMDRETKGHQGKLRKRVDRLAQIIRISLDLNTTKNLDELLHLITGTAARITNHEAASILLLDPETKKLHFKAAYGARSEELKPLVVPLDGSIAGWVVQNGEAAVVSDVEEDSRHYRKVDWAINFHTDSLLAVPMMIREHCVGVLEVVNKTSAGDTEEETMYVLSALASQAAVAIQNARLYEQTLRDASHRRDLMESMAEGLMEFDIEGRVVQVNRAMCLMTRFGRQEFVDLESTPPHWPEDKTEEYSAFLEWIVTEGTSVGPLELMFRRSDGEVFPALVSFSPVRDEEGEITGLINVLQDLTERKALEERLRQAQKLEAIGTLASGIAHDFNNILMGIMGYTSLLQRKLPLNSPFRGDTTNILIAARRAADLTKQILSFASQGERQVERVFLNGIVREVASLVAHTVDRRIKINRDLEAGLPLFQGDATQLQQVVLNLCINACDAMPQGGVLTLRTHSLEISESEAAEDVNLEPGPYVALEAEDTGVGMDTITQGRIFEPFFTTKEHGRGLGLATCYGIVRAHGGTIRVQSSPGRGTTFRVLIPARAVVEPEEIPMPHIGPVDGNETVLVVDDEPMVREILAESLRSVGYEILEATNGREAVELFAEHSNDVDLVVLDLIMPEMSGVDTLVRMLEIDPHVKVLVSSGYGPEQARLLLLDKGAADFLPKPYDVDQVLVTVRQILNSQGGA